jgi:hypothetical protein
MGPKKVSAAILCAALLAWSGASFADEYRPDEFLGLDLSQAVLSPKRLGPATEFAPVRIEAMADPKPVRTERVSRAKTQVSHQVSHQVTTHVAHARAEKPRGAARTKLARRHGNPLDAQASDTRIQAWPCKSGGICNWR